MKSGLSRREVILAGGAAAVAGVLPARAFARIGSVSSTSNFTLACVACGFDELETVAAAGGWLEPGSREIAGSEKRVVLPLDGGIHRSIEGVFGGRSFVASERVRLRVLGVCRAAEGLMNMSVDVLHPSRDGWRAHAVVRGRESSPVEMTVRAIDGGVGLRVLGERMMLVQPGLYVVRPNGVLGAEPVALLRRIGDSLEVNLVCAPGGMKPCDALLVSVRREKGAVHHAG